MSTTPPNEEEAPAPPPESWSIPTLKVVGAGVGALVLFGVTVFITYLLMERWRGDSPPEHLAPLPPAIGHTEINFVHQTYFPTIDYTNRGQGDARHTLDSYGWVDRSRGIIHMPVDAAIDALAAQQGGPRP